MTPRESLLALAVHNNAVWCDTVCRHHDAQGEFRDHAWFTTRPTPPYYPNMVTLTPGSARLQLELIDEIVGAVGETHDVGVKDSYASLDLASRGFQPIVEAQWFALPSPRATGRPTGVAVVASDAELTEWERAWGASSPTTVRMFRQELLGDDDVCFMAIREVGVITAGLIANRSPGAVGISNFFAQPSRARDFVRDALAMIAARYPGLPIVGYAGDSQLTLMLRHGFEAVGPLTVWIRPRGHA
jgi:hypothetical protein